MAGKERESFVRWQRITIEQVGFVNNLLIGLAAGIIVLQATILFGREIILGNAEKGFFSSSLVLLFLSLIAGILTAWNRLIDFRKTMAIAREQRRNGDHEKIHALRNEAIHYGKRTWKLLGAQTIFFCLGALALLLVVLVHLHSGMSPTELTKQD